MKYGLKLWSRNANLLEQAAHLIAEKVFSYIELLIEPDYLEINTFLEHDIEYAIHIPHERFGVDIGQLKCKEYTLDIIKKCSEIADILNSDSIIIHAGTGSANVAKDNLSKIEDTRILIENMPVMAAWGGYCLGFDRESVSELMDVNNFGLCLDLGHAVKAAVSLKIDYKKFIGDFISEQPKIFHLSDGDISDKRDKHLNISEGNFDLKYLIKCVEKSKFRMVSLETPRMDNNSLYEDLVNLEKLRTIGI